MVAQNIKRVMCDIVTPINSKIAILLSAGIDSHSILFECLSQNKDIICYTFGLENHISTDMKCAMNTCKLFGVEHRIINLPVDISILISDIKRLKDIGAKSKTDFECFWCFLYAYDIIKEENIISGLGADGHFCISKTGMIHHRDNIDEYRKILFDNPNYCQRNLHSKYSTNHIMPYLTDEMRSVFVGTSWNEINKPHQKQVIIDAYSDYFSQIKIRNHTNYQKGDSEISNHFNQLLKTYLNTGDFKSVVSIYNRL